MKFSLTFLALTAATASADVLSLTPDNWDAMTDGKTVFVKFFAPWCGHCKKMAPDWETLATEWEGHEVGLIADVDCTAEGKPLCDAQGVKGFPTLKYGDPNALEDYSGGRSLSDFQAFAKENLKPVCSPAKLDLCDDAKKAEIEGLMAMADEDINAKIAVEEKKLEDAEEDFKNEVQKLQEKYQSLMDEKDAKAAAVKSAGLGLMKSVLAFKKKADKEL
jgi:protein disulfide-isomerase-like protein